MSESSVKVRSTAWLVPSLVPRTASSPIFEVPVRAGEPAWQLALASAVRPLTESSGPVGAISAGDFVFKAGNTLDPSTWADASAPTGVTVRPGSGVNGSTRVEITWADGAIANTWLQVTLKANGVTNLSADDVFYFGNAIGESGNSATDAAVTTADVLAARGRISVAAASITSAWDYNRDGVVSAADVSVAQGHLTAGDAVLVMLNAPALPVTSPLETAELNLPGPVGGTTTTGTNSVAPLTTTSAVEVVEPVVAPMDVPVTETGVAPVVTEVTESPVTIGLVRAKEALIAAREVKGQGALHENSAALAAKKRTAEVLEKLLALLGRKSF